MSSLLAGDLHPLARLSLSSRWQRRPHPSPLPRRVPETPTHILCIIATCSNLFVTAFLKGIRKGSERPLKGQSEWRGLWRIGIVFHKKRARAQRCVTDECVWGGGGGHTALCEVRLLCFGYWWLHQYTSRRAGIDTNWWLWSLFVLPKRWSSSTR